VATTIRDVMTKGCECIGETETLTDAARKLKALDVGALPICGEDDRLKGMLTDRDIVVKAIAEGRDPGTTRAGDLGEGTPVWVGEDDSVDDALEKMSEHAIRRLPVIGEDRRLTGIVAQADLAIHAKEKQVGEAVQEISQAPPS